VFAWKDNYDIIKIILPAFDGLLLEQLYLPTSKDVTERIKFLTDSIKGWQSIVDRVAQLHQRADDGDLSKTTASAITSTNVHVGATDLERDGSIVAPELLDNLKDLNGNSVSASQDGASKIAVVKAYSAISFSGGGSELTFAASAVTEEASLDTITVAFELKAGVKAELSGKIFGVGVKGDKGGGILGNYEHEQGIETQGSRSSTRSFTLSDPDDGDAFDVQV
jgi:hypothetical protein